MNLKETFTSLPAMQARDKIPPHKRRLQWVNTLVGLGIIAGTIFVRVKLWPDLHWLGVAAGCYAGGFVASKQLMQDIAKGFAQMIGSIVAAMAGKKDGGALTPLVAGLAVAGGAFLAFLQAPVSAAGEFSLGVTIGILIGEALAMLGAPYIIKKFGMSFGAFTSEAQRENTAVMLELTKLLKATGETSVIRASDEQRKREVA